MTRLILIRHGQTHWNLKKRYCGFNNIGLNNKGKKQAEKLRQRLKEEKIHKVYSSDRRRALQTARIIFNALRVEKIPDLREMNFGCFEGLKHEEIIKNYAKVYKKWLKNPFRANIPGAEKLTSFRKRVVAAFKEIASVNPNRTVAVVCHGGSISAFVTHVLKTKTFWKYIPHSGSLSIIEYKNNKAKIKLFNDIRHLIPPKAGCR